MLEALQKPSSYCWNLFDGNWFAWNSHLYCRIVRFQLSPFMIIEIDGKFNSASHLWRFLCSTKDAKGWGSGWTHVCVSVVLWQATKLFHNFRQPFLSAVCTLESSLLLLSEIFYFLFICKAVAGCECMFHSVSVGENDGKSLFRVFQYSEALMRSNLSGTFFYCFIILYSFDIGIDEKESEGRQVESGLK